MGVQSQTLQLHLRYWAPDRWETWDRERSPHLGVTRMGIAASQLCKMVLLHASDSTSAKVIAQATNICQWEPANMGKFDSDQGPRFINWVIVASAARILTLHSGTVSSRRVVTYHAAMIIRRLVVEKMFPISGYSSQILREKVASSSPPRLRNCRSKHQSRIL